MFLGMVHKLSAVTAVCMVSMHQIKQSQLGPFGASFASEPMCSKANSGTASGYI